MILLGGVALVVFLIDRLTKYLVQQNLPANQPRPFLDSLVYLTHTQNSGAAFSLGRSFGVVYLGIAIIAAGVILYVYPRVPRHEIASRVALGMILGGAVGNAFDRVLFGSVTDFIDLRFWPVFNLADSSIVVAALVLAWRLQRLNRTEE